MTRCTLSGRPLVELPGEVVSTEPYVFGAEVPDLDARVYGPCYEAALRARPEARRLREAVRRHATTVAALVCLADDGEHALLHNPRTRTLELLSPAGERTTLPPRERLTAARLEGDLAFVELRVEANVHHLPPELVASLGARLRRDRAAPLALLVDALSVRDALVHPAAVDHGRLEFDRGLARYATPTSLSVRLVAELAVPRALYARALAA